MDVLVKVVGYRSGTWTDKATGELKTWREIYVVHAEDPEDEEVTGQSVEILRAPDNIKLEKLVIGGWYDLLYKMRNTRQGKMAFLIGMEPLSAEELAGLESAGAA